MTSLRLAAERQRATTADRRHAIIIFGELGCGNLGNDGSMEAVIQRLRQLDDTSGLHVIGYGPEVINETFGVTAESMNLRPASTGNTGRSLALLWRIALRFLDLPRTWVQVRSARAVLVAGAGVFEGDLGTRPTGLPLAFWRTALACRIAGIPLILVAVGVSPVRERASRWLFATGLRWATEASYRDQRSLDLARRWTGRPNHGVLSGDLAFALPLPPTTTQPNLVAVGVMANGGWPSIESQESYIAETVELVARLVERGYRVRLVIGDKMDLAVMRVVHDRVQRPDRVECCDLSSLTDLAYALANVAAVVAVRFHNVVTALRLGKPTVAVAYASKTRDLMDRVGLAEFALALDDYTGAVVLARLEWAIQSQAVPNQTALRDIEATLEADLSRVVAQVKAAS
jgi:polysaccharide pyruvyl transferase WcaK-like protein